MQILIDLFWALATVAFYFAGIPFAVMLIIYLVFPGECKCK